MGVGVVLKVLELRIELRYQPLEKTKHVAFDVRIGIFVYRQRPQVVCCVKI